jgi:hypothetical protein
VVELAGTLVADFDVVELLSLLADRCVEVNDVAAAGLMVARPCATMPATTTFASSSSLKISSAAIWPPRHWTVRLRR